MYILAGIMFPISCPHQSGGSGEPGNQSGGSGDQSGPGGQGNQGTSQGGHQGNHHRLFGSSYLIALENIPSQQHGFKEKSKGQVTAKS